MRRFVILFYRGFAVIASVTSKIAGKELRMTIKSFAFEKSSEIIGRPIE